MNDIKMTLSSSTYLGELRPDVMVLSYRHAFHAGNIADVLKHVVVTTVAGRLSARAKAERTPLSYVETHAGIGLYDLTSEQARKRNEHKTGIAQLLASPAFRRTANAAALRPYLECIQSYNVETSATRWYPGSPAYVAPYLSKDSRVVLCELHPSDVETLRENSKDIFPDHQNVQIQPQCGFQFLRKEAEERKKRVAAASGSGELTMCLIDPPYEHPSEYQMIVQGLFDATKAFQQGTHILWYPLLRDNISEAVTKKSRALIKAKSALKRCLLGNTIYEIELDIVGRIPEENSSGGDEPGTSGSQKEPRSKRHSSLRGCGLILVNPENSVVDHLEADVLPAIVEAYPSLSGDDSRRTRMSSQWI